MEVMAEAFPFIYWTRENVSPTSSSPSRPHGALVTEMHQVGTCATRPPPIHTIYRLN